MSHTSDLSGLSKQYAARDLPSNLKLKYRETGQGAPDEVKKDKKELRRELEEKEKSTKDGKRSSSLKEETKEEKHAKKQKVEAITNLDADEPIVDDDDEDNESNDEIDDDEDETAELLKELERIKKERASEAAKQEADRLKQEEKVRVENVLKGNPLLNQQKNEFQVKRRWNDDVVFKNCAKGDDKIVKKGFINDTLRSDFHKKFMERYIK